MLGTTYLGNTIGQYILFLSLLAAAIVAGKLLTWTSKQTLRVFADKTATKADDLMVSILEGPVIFSIFIVAMYFAKPLLTYSVFVSDLYDKFISVLFMLNVAWYLMRFINGLIEHYLEPLSEKSNTDLDDHLLPILRRLVNIMIVIIVAIMIIDRFGYNVGSLLAGLGLGGLAFALAAKDLVGNLFGGLAILTDKPFKLGDRIKINEVDGYVREIGLRTTRIETFGGTMIVLPNSKVVDGIVENVTAEKQRRMFITLGVEYSTSSAKLEKAKKLIAKNIKSVDGLNHEKFTVAFSEFADSSLNLKVIYWITKSGLKRYSEVNDELLSGIKKDFEKAKIEFAYPSQTVYVKK